MYKIIGSKYEFKKRKVMKKIKIYSKIRNDIPDFGNLPKCDKEKEIIHNTNNKIVISELKDQLMLVLDDISKDEEFELYCLAPNAMLVSITYILKKLGYKFTYIPKPTDEENWGWKDINIKEQDLDKFIIKKTDFIKFERYNKACIILTGKYNISEKSNKVFCDKESIIVNKGNDYSGNNIITVTHNLKLEEDTFKSLVNKNCFNKFRENIDDIFNDLCQFKDLKEVHIISSIPAIGLLYLGEKMSDAKYDNIVFYIYNYKDDAYKLGSILNSKLLIGEKNV